MCRGRDTDHHPQALRRLSSALLTAILVAGMGGFAHAGHLQKVSGDGVVHRVDVEAASGPAIAGGTFLRHTLQHADGSKLSQILPGTEDFFVDREPALEIDPVTDHPVVVWSRDQDVGFDIFLSRFDGVEWSMPFPVFQGTGNDVKPEIRITSRRIHIIWRNQTPSVLHLNLDRETLAPIYGPETLPTEGIDMLSPEGGAEGAEDDVSPSPPRDATFFTGEIDLLLPGMPPRIFVWGVRDEPVPVGYSQGLLLDPELSPVRSSSAGWVGERFAVWFISPDDGFSYIFRDNGHWTTFRRIMLDEDTRELDAKNQMEEMLLRIGPDLPD